MNRNLRWHEGSTGQRILAMRGDAPIGAIFPPWEGRSRARWRVWVTKNMNPVEGTARHVEAAKVEIEKRFEEFLALAKLQPIPEGK